MKWLIAGLLLGMACAGTRPATTSSPRGKEGVMAQQSGYLVLKDGSIHLASDGPPSGLHVLGMVEGGRFEPQGSVQGDGPLGDSGQPGWMELNDGIFHGDQTARPPFPPYIRGYRRDGEFRPSTRDITY